MAGVELTGVGGVSPVTTCELDEEVKEVLAASGVKRKPARYFITDVQAWSMLESRLTVILLYNVQQKVSHKKHEHNVFKIQLNISRNEHNTKKLLLYSMSSSGHVGFIGLKIWCSILYNVYLLGGVPTLLPIVLEQPLTILSK